MRKTIFITFLVIFCAVIVNTEHDSKIGVYRYDLNDNPQQNPTNSSKGCGNLSIMELASNIDETFFRERLWYTTASTTMMYNLIATVLLGRPPQGQRELENMCHTRIFGNGFTKPIEMIFGGYGVQYVVSSVPTGRYGMFQTHLNLDPATFDQKLGVNPSVAPPGPITVSLLKTDNKSYSIFLLCLGDTVDMALNTVTPFVSSEIKAIYKNLAVEMGIDLNGIQFLRCLPPSSENSTI